MELVLVVDESDGLVDGEQSLQRERSDRHRVHETTHVLEIVHEAADVSIGIDQVVSDVERVVIKRGVFKRTRVIGKVNIYVDSEQVDEAIERA